MLPCRTGRAETENPLPPGRRQCIFRIFVCRFRQNIVEFVNEIRYEKLFRRTRLHGAVPARGLCLRHAEPARSGDGDPLPGNPGAKSYKNPVFREFLVADPTVIRAEDGNFYLYATESGKNNIPILRSSDLVNWTKVG